MSENFGENDGVWRTISGRRIFIRNGESLSQAMARSGGVTQLEIKQYSGCLISQFSRNPGENEVLLPRGFKWRVTKVEYLDNGYTKVYGEEVE